MDDASKVCAACHPALPRHLVRRGRLRRTGLFRETTDIRERRRAGGNSSRYAPSHHGHAFLRRSGIPSGAHMPFPCNGLDREAEHL
jgi:hypothetical protein